MLTVDGSHPFGSLLEEEVGTLMHAFAPRGSVALTGHDSHEPQLLVGTNGSFHLVIPIDMDAMKVCRFHEGN